MSRYFYDFVEKNTATVFHLYLGSQIDIIFRYKDIIKHVLPN